MSIRIKSKNMQNGLLKILLGAAALLSCLGYLVKQNLGSFNFTPAVWAQEKGGQILGNATTAAKEDFLLRETEAQAAAEANAKLEDELTWEFGGKIQRGWRIYAPLIYRLVDAEDGNSDAARRMFAEKVARWQQRVGIARTGIVDRDTLSQMIAAWQAERIKEKVVPTVDRLVTVAPSSWFDETREEQLRRVEQRAYAAYRAMLAAAMADKSLNLLTVRDAQGGLALAPAEKRFKLVSAFRSQAYQNQLRARAGNPSRAALALTSPHLTGCAIDLYIAGEPVDTSDFNRLLQTSSPVYLWLVKNARKFGFVPYFYEPWHWEYVGNEKMETPNTEAKSAPSSVTNIQSRTSN